MEWAVIMEGRTDPAAIVVLLEERGEAELIAGEICRRGPRVVVRPYTEKATAATLRKDS